MGTDPRSDLYALAATIYRLITGRVPSDALTRATAALERLPDPLRPANKLNSQVPEAVAAVLTRALSQLPDDRPATATEMRQALRAAVQPQAPDYYDTATSIDRPHIDGPRIDDSWMESDLLGEDRVIASLGPTKSSVSDVTNAGWIVAPSPAPGVDEQGAGAAFAWLRSGSARTVGVALSLLLLVIAALAYWRLNPMSGSGEANPPAGETAGARPGSLTPTPPPFVEALRYYLQAESKSGRAKRGEGKIPDFKFHFAPSQEGYLYIIGPGERGARVTFLTAQPNPAWGVKDNRLAEGINYSFPPRRNMWIRVAHVASSRAYTIIFTPEPLVQPRFLAGPAGHALTAAEEGELREQFGQSARVEMQGAKNIVKIPAESVSKAPFLFEVNLHLGADEEGGQR
jgi:hypothetical protein